MEELLLFPPIQYFHPSLSTVDAVVNCECTSLTLKGNEKLASSCQSAVICVIIDMTMKLKFSVHECECVPFYSSTDFLFKDSTKARLARERREERERTQGMSEGFYFLITS